MTKLLKKAKDSIVLEKRKITKAYFKRAIGEECQSLLV